MFPSLYAENSRKIRKFPNFFMISIFPIHCQENYFGIYVESKDTILNFLMTSQKTLLVSVSSKINKKIEALDRNSTRSL